MRLRVSVEARDYFDHQVPFDSIRQIEPVAGFAVGIFVGLEGALIKSTLPALSR